jgi:predicted DNA-binding transcriptional regulator AlpA
MKPRRILRPKPTWAKLGCGKTKFETDYRFHSDDDPFVPGTKIPRLKALALGERNVGFLEHEADALIDALAELRDAPPSQIQRTPVAPSGPPGALRYVGGHQEGEA